jgi:hypothetical protein
MSVRYTMGITGTIISGVVIVNGILALVGLCVYNRDSVAFKFSHWMHMITFWSLLAFLSMQLHYWDGGYKPLKSSSSSTTTGGTVKSPPKGATTFLQIDIAAPSQSAVKDFFSFMSSPVWFLSLTAVLIGMNILYIYGSLRIRTRLHARWGAAVVSWVSLFAGLAAVALTTYSLIAYTEWRKWNLMLGLISTGVGAIFTVCLAIVSFWADTQIKTEQVKASERLNLVLYLTIPAVIFFGGSYYLYWATLTHSPLHLMVQISAFLGISTQLLLFTLIMLLVVWRNNITDEFKSQLGTELYADSESYVVDP